MLRLFPRLTGGLSGGHLAISVAAAAAATAAAAAAAVVAAAVVAVDNDDVSLVLTNAATYCAHH